MTEPGNQARPSARPNLRGGHGPPWRAIQTKQAPSHLSFMAQGIAVNGFLFVVSIPRDAQTLEIPSDFEGQARLAFQNLGAVLEAADSGFQNVIKLTVYLSDIANWAEMNEVYKRYVNVDRPPVRLTTETGRLNNDYMIELDAIALESA